MKYVLALVMTMIIVTGCMMTGSRKTSLPNLYEPAKNEQIWHGEIYEGSGAGYRGPVKVQVRLDEGVITEIVILESMEDRFVGFTAMEELVETVIEYNSTDIDVISGATVSSQGFLEAVNNAIMKHETSFHVRY